MTLPAAAKTSFDSCQSVANVSRLSAVVLGSSHPLVADALLPMSRCFRTSRLELSGRLATEARLIARKQSMLTWANACLVLGSIADIEGRYEAAKKEFRFANKCFVEMYGEQHPACARTSRKISELSTKRDMGGSDFLF